MTSAKTCDHCGKPLTPNDARGTDDCIPCNKAYIRLVRRPTDVATETIKAINAVRTPTTPRLLYAVRLADGSFMSPRKPFGDVPSFVVFTDPAHAGNAVVWMKEQNKIDPEADYDVVPVGSVEA